MVRTSGQAFDGDPGFDLLVNGQIVAQRVAAPSPDAERMLAELAAAAVSPTFALPVGTEVDTVEVEFVNDCFVGSQDRDLFIASLCVDGATVEPSFASADACPGPAAFATLVEEKGLILRNGAPLQDFGDAVA